MPGGWDGNMTISTSKPKLQKMARTKKRKPGGARRHKDGASKAQQPRASVSAQGATESRRDGERPAKKARLEKGTALSKSDIASGDVVQDPEKRRDKKARFGDSTPAVPARPKPANAPPASLQPKSLQSTTPIETTEHPSLRTKFASSLSKTHDVISLSITSSSSIQKKVSKVLSHLSSSSTSKPLLAVLTAKAGVASKAITIAEISKREIGKNGGVWFQYSGVEGVLEEWTPKKRGRKSGGEKEDRDTGGREDTTLSEGPTEGVAEAAQENVDRRNGEEDEDEEEEAFEVMRNPPIQNQEAQEHPSITEGELRKKVRAVPVMTIYLSRNQVGELKKAYG